MNLDLYNFHIRASSAVTSSTSLPHTSSSLNIPPKRSFDPIQYCRSWNDGACRWSLGQCRYRHVCERCNGQHPLTNCPVRAYKGSQRYRSLTSLGENAVGFNYKVALQVAGINFGSFWEAASVTGTLSRVTSGLAVMDLGVSKPRARSPSLSAMARRSLQLGVGAHSWVVLLCQSWGHYFSLGAGCR